MSRPIAVLQARLGSTRLPRKVLADLCGKTVLERQMERLKRCQTLAEVVVLIPSGPEDAELAQLCVEKGWAYSATQEPPDVLVGYAKAAVEFDADPVIRVTADCPLLDWGVIDGGVRLFLSGGADYVSNNLERTFPHGFDFEIVSQATLLDVDEKCTDPFEREHVLEYVRRRQDRPYRLGNLRFPLHVLHPAEAAVMVAARLTVDYEEDLALVREIYERFPADHYITTADILDLLVRFPSLMAINEQRAIDHAQALTGASEPLSVAQVQAMKRRKRRLLKAVGVRH